MNSESSPQPLLLSWIDHKAALYAVTHWHYSKCLPAPPIIKIGVWEYGKFIGCVLFSRGANNNLGAPYGLGCTEVCELTRVALDKHEFAVSRILAVSFKIIKKHCPGLKLIVSYADPNKKHHGGIYQAGNWVYSGKSAPDAQYRDRNGKLWHSRLVNKNGFKKQFGQMKKTIKTSDFVKILLEGKHRYLMPLDIQTSHRIKLLSKPYPKRAQSIDATEIILSESLS